MIWLVLCVGVNFCLISEVKFQQEITIGSGTMANGGLSNEALVLLILDIIRVHRLRITCCLLAYGLLEDGDEDLAGRRVRRRFSHTERIPKQVEAKLLVIKQLLQMDFNVEANEDDVFEFMFEL
ncbi:hypothetical protein SASPL_108222 [Salvia splendens]|uniref:Uncharacterized protein n=1 Tax=Salvia splendens TaxID=180675 RepID=A0A8X8YHQ7_SALSN|nr:hypothetical protein SASPL_108222 [Salvia splendens]